jgi:hypothetical protein
MYANPARLPIAQLVWLTVFAIGPSGIVPAWDATGGLGMHKVLAVSSIS